MAPATIGIFAQRIGAGESMRTQEQITLLCLLHMHRYDLQQAQQGRDQNLPGGIGEHTGVVCFLK